MTFVAAYKAFWKNYFNFTGRALRERFDDENIEYIL